MGCTLPLREAGGGRRLSGGGRLLLLFLLFLTTSVQAQPPLITISFPLGKIPVGSSEREALGILGAFGYVHTATGTLPPPSTEPLEALIARAERGEIRLAVIGEPLKGLPKIRRLRLLGKEIPASSAITSPSTRTLGLVTMADLTGEGRSPEFVRGGWRQIRSLGDWFEATEEAKIPVLVLWGSLAGLGLALGIVALRKPKLVKAARSALAVATAGTLALLPAGLAPYAAAQIALFFFATLLIAASSRPEKRPSAVTDILQLFGVLVVLDTIFVWGMVAHSALSGYYDSGIRFYGIGNEYMGLLIGAVLMSVPKRFLGWVGTGIVLLLGLPMLGANAGGAMAACVAFFPPLKGKRWRGLLPFVVVAALAGLDRLQPGAVQSHIGQAAGKGASAWGEIIVRKLAMNARLTVAGPTLVAMVAVGVGGWQLKGLFARLDDELQGRVVLGLWGAGAVIVFNDSGTVAALLLLAPVIVTCLDRALRLTESKVSSGILTPGAERL